MQPIACKDCGAVVYRNGNRKYRCDACQRKANAQANRRARSNPQSNSYIPKHAEILSHMKESDYAHTLEEVAQEFGITRERVRQIQNIAINKLRKHKDWFWSL